MRLPRMTTRRWMLAVALVAVSFWGGRAAIRLKRESARRLSWAARHDAIGGELRLILVKMTARAKPRVLRNLRDQIEHHAEIARKYAAAAYRPWLPIEPDPPEPE
jgi:hypothetical protein